MQVESIHHLIACAFVLMWVLIGLLTMRRQPNSDQQDVPHRRVDPMTSGVQRPATPQKTPRRLTSSRL